MADPVLHLLAGPNGSGKSTFWARVLEPELHLAFVNADAIAATRWPDDPESHAYEAAELAAARRQELMASRRSYASETVFSHESKIELVRDAVEVGYLVTLHVIAVPENLAVDRVENRVENGGHTVPENKVRERYKRLWAHVADAIRLAEQSRVYDNTTGAAPFRLIRRVRARCAAVVKVAVVDARVITACEPRLRSTVPSSSTFWFRKAPHMGVLGTKRLSVGEGRDCGRLAYRQLHAAQPR